MAENIGFINEKRICDRLNNKRFCELNDLYKEFLIKLYGYIEEVDLIKCRVDYNKHKFDLIISVRGINKFISVKKGRKNSFHAESLYTFINYLKRIGISDESISLYKHFHDGEGMSSVKYKELYQENINFINKELCCVEILNEFINRFVIKRIGAIPIDGVLCGTDIYFNYYSVKEIREVLIFHLNKISTGIHCSSFFISLMTRNLIGNIKYEYKKYDVVIKCYDLEGDFIEMSMYKSII